jgi:hypothetical protein
MLNRSSLLAALAIAGLPAAGLASELDRQIARGSRSAAYLPRHPDVEYARNGCATNPERNAARKAMAAAGGARQFKKVAKSMRRLGKTERAAAAVAA